MPAERKSELLKMHENHGTVAFVNHCLTEIEGVNGIIADLPAGRGLSQDAGEHHVPVRQSDECGDPLSDAGDEEFVVGHGVVGVVRLVAAQQALSEGLRSEGQRRFWISISVSRINSLLWGTPYASVMAYQT